MQAPYNFFDIFNIVLRKMNFLAPYKTTVPVQKLIRFSVEKALQLQHSEMMVQHLWLGVCEFLTPRTRRAFSRAEYSPGRLARNLESKMTLGGTPMTLEGLNLAVLLVVLKEAHAQALSERKAFIDIEHVALALTTPELPGVETLDRKRFREGLSDKDVLDFLGIDLVDEAAQERLDRVVCRDDEIDRLVATLQVRRPKMSLLVGGTGVGKTSIVHGLAHRISSGKVPPNLQNARLIQVALDSFLSSGKEPEKFENRVKTVISAARNSRTILFFDDLSQFTDDRYNELFFRYADLLRSAINDAEILLVGAITTTPSTAYAVEREWYKGRLDVIEVMPLDAIDSSKAIKENLHRIGAHYQLQITPAAVDQIVLLISRHNRFGQLPGAAFRLLDELASQILVKHAVKPDFEELNSAIENLTRQKEDAVAEQNFEQAAALRDQSDILKKIKTKLTALISEVKQSYDFALDGEAVAADYGDVTGLPELWSLLGKNRSASLAEVREILSKNLTGQADVVDQIVRLATKWASGLQASGRPLSSLLFAGPSGTGKTLLSQLIARHLLGTDLLLVIDVTAYSDQAGHERLSDDLNRLMFSQTEMRDASLPRGIVVIDHLELANEQLRHTILSWFRDDWYGKAEQWRQSLGCGLLIMMTRGGINEPLWRSALAMPQGDFEAARLQIRESMDSHLRHFFPTDFLNRLDSILFFDSFTRADIEVFLQRLLDTLRVSLSDEHISLSIDACAREWLISRSQIPTLGARAIQWNFERYLVQPIMEELAMSPTAPEREVQVSGDLISGAEPRIAVKVVPTGL